MAISIALFVSCMVPLMSFLSPRSAVQTVVIFSFMGASVAAQGVPPNAPNAGQELRTIEQMRPPLAQPVPAPEVEAEEPAPQKKRVVGANEKFLIRDISIVGNVLISMDEIAPLFDSLKGQRVGFDELKLAIDEVTLLYQSKGLLGRALLPSQDVTEGIIRIQIVEANFGGAEMSLDPDIDYLVDPDIIKNIVEAMNEKGAPLNLETLERAILIASDLPGVLANQSLQAGTAPGETIALVRMINEPATLRSVMADNYGSLSTGDHRLMYVSSRLSPTGIGDRTNFVALFTEGNSYVSLTYDWPSGYRGMMLGASASALEYEVVEGAAVDLNLKGTASTARLTMSKPFIRSRLQSLSMQGAVERKVFYNESVFGEESDYVVDVASLGLTYSRVHDILLGGEFSASTTVFLGRNNFNDSPAAFTLAKKNEQVDGHYSMLSASANYTQFINDDYTGMVKFTGQLANDNLDSSSRMYLGGAEAVRAYPSGEAGGSNAFIVNLEVNRTIGDSFTAGLFYDYGYVRQYVSDRNASTGQPLVLGADENRVRLRGGGLSLVWEGASGFTVTSSVSRRIGANPNRSVTGKDSNGRGEKTFFWLQGMARF